MLRIILLFCILGMGLMVDGQGVAVRKSADVVVIRGKSYYLHTVEAGQTLYSICKAYGADLEEVKRLNGKADNNLSLYEVLKVPYTEVFVQQDAKYYYHKVTARETLYSIARRYGVKVRRLEKWNEKVLQGGTLPIGTTLRMPLYELDPLVLEREKHVQEKQIFQEEIVQEQASVEQPEEKPVIKAEQATLQVQEQVKQDTHLLQQRETVMPEYISEVVLPSDPYVKVALLLPLYAGGLPWMSDSLALNSLSISPRSEQFVYFYEGILLAVDSLKEKGYQIDLRVYDTQRNPEFVYGITEELNQWNPDLVIGPVYGSVFKVVASNLQNRNIPLVYPLSSRREDFAAYPNFVQVNASFETLANKMADWIALQSVNANIIHINLSETDTEDELALVDMTEKKLFTNRLHQLSGIQFFKWNFTEEPLVALKQLLLPDRENIIVLPATKEAEVSKILPSLSAYAENYQITVLGFPEWQTFTAVEHETFFKLNTKIFTYSYIDNQSTATQQFAQQFRRYFYTEPNSLAFKAFDLGLYFIELAAKYRDRALDAIQYYHQDGAFSRFYFEQMQEGQGKENQGFYMVTFGSDYQLKIEHL